MPLCDCAYAHPVHAYPVAARGRWDWAERLLSQSKYRQRKPRHKTVQETMLRQDNLPGEKDEANSSSHTEIDDLNKKILYQDVLLRKKDEANSNLSTLNGALKTQILHKDDRIQQLHTANLNLHTKIDDLKK